MNRDGNDIKYMELAMEQKQAIYCIRAHIRGKESILVLLSTVENNGGEAINSAQG